MGTIRLKTVIKTSVLTCLVLMSSATNSALVNTFSAGVMNSKVLYNFSAGVADSTALNKNVTLGDTAAPSSLTTADRNVEFVRVQCTHPPKVQKPQKKKPKVRKKPKIAKKTTAPLENNGLLIKKKPRILSKKRQKIHPKYKKRPVNDEEECYAPQVGYVPSPPPLPVAVNAIKAKQPAQKSAAPIETPIPAAIFMFAPGVLGLLGFSKRRKRNGC